jgi:cob(I)alamin adenosyltransferase
MKLYTKTGDDGSTGLFGGERVGKDSVRVEAYGCVDELNGYVGWAASAVGVGELKPMLVRIQSWLFDLGSELAAPAVRVGAGEKGGAGAVRLEGEQVAELEGWIDRVCMGLPELRNFVLPGGCEASARLHVARGVCRRAERVCVALSRVEPVRGEVVVFLNRLGDLLFAMARRANQLAGEAEVLWNPRGR